MAITSRRGHHLGAWPSLRGVAITKGRGHHLGAWPSLRGVAITERDVPLYQDVLIMSYTLPRDTTPMVQTDHLRTCHAMCRSISGAYLTENWNFGIMVHRDHVKAWHADLNMNN